MPWRNDNATSSTLLRKRLLLASISLSLLVILTFCYVGYGVATGMGEKVESQAYNQQTEAIAEAIERQLQLQPNYFDTLGQRPLPEYINTAGKNLVSLHTANGHIIKGPSPLFIRHEKVNQLAMGEAGRFVILDDARFYVTRSHIGNQGALTLIWRDLSGISLPNHILIRIAVTALLTFGIAVWLAMIMSSRIASRFESARHALEKLAMHDSLTNLPNRNALISSSPQEIQGGTLLFLDIDRFKDVNDAFGQDVGDKLLHAFAQRLLTLSGPESDVYHYRSDEFVVWMPSLQSEDAKNAAFTMLYECREPLQVDNASFELGCSIGAACYPAHGHLFETLLRNADTAMHWAKARRLGVQVYDDKLAFNSTIKVMLRSQLRSALQQNQFVLHYQPKVVMDTGTLIGVEAIVRWQHPEEGLLGPALFIDLVEQSGIIHVFTRYMVESAIRQIQQWCDMGHQLPVSVNLSAYNLLDTAFVSFIHAQLEQSGIAPSLLEFELTESAAMIDKSASKRTVDALLELGVKVSIDDFGTGMSSFAYLRDLNVNTVKLDRAFITHIVDDVKGQKVVEGLVSLCRSLDLDVVAEGVEDRRQADLLQQLDCHIGQGYFFSPPVEAESISQLLPQSQAFRYDYVANN
ncbi:putative bifunctional diguanylate cyclase/phosphodiesterase [Alteromonas sp. H39]|uniref:putative bifunctional diguanylate cyclase/phosphodiesterase n=1 Tax=Alteromonas sp. H39 TaxID=3389876 RepID=UPI0039E1850D